MKASRTVLFSGRVGALFLLLALLGCATPRPPAAPPDPELPRLTALARHAVAAGRPADAVPLYSEALRRARASAAESAVAAQAQALANCLLAADRGAEAAPYIAEAALALGLAPDGIWPADLRLLAAKAAWARGQTDAAAREAQAALEAARLDDQRAVEIEALLILALGEALAGRSDPAQTRLLAAAPLGLARQPAHVRALAARVQGELAAAAGAADEAVTHFLAAADLLNRPPEWPQRAAMISRAADAQVATGEIVGAIRLHYQAARAWAAQGRTVPALRQIEAAVELFARSGPVPELQQALARLVTEVNEGVASSVKKSEPLSEEE